MIADWDDAYANRAHVPDAPAILDALPGLAEAFRAQARATLDIAYGPGPRERYDLFMPETPPRGLVVFVHGGYWLLFDKSAWSHYAAGAVEAGYAVAMPSYPVSPAARMPEITAAVGSAVTHAAGQVDGPIYLVGHSAGGHLVARMITNASPLPLSLRQRITRCVPISGLFDLRPLLRLSMNADWKLDRETAMAESPVFQDPDPHVHVTAVVGGAERPEFLRHTSLLENAWTGCGGTIASVVIPALHHFNVIDGLLGRSDELIRFVTGDYSA